MAIIFFLIHLKLNLQRNEGVWILSETPVQYINEAVYIDSSHMAQLRIWLIYFYKHQPKTLQDMFLILNSVEKRETWLSDKADFISWL